MDIKKISKVAIMGGTFDPIHNGHLIAAEAAREYFELDKVVFVPVGIPPHKDKNKITNGVHRYNMVFLATLSNSYFEVSDIELRKNEICYTVDTIKDFRKIYPDAELFFITGADAILDILNWKNTAELFELCNWVAVTRPGYNKDVLDKLRTDLKKDNLYILEIPALAISSTEIRDKVKKGQSIRYLVPELVQIYIDKNNLYR